MNYQANDGLPRKPRRSKVVAVAPERLRAVKKARRHSFVVRVLRVVLPLAAIAVLGLYFISSNLTISLGNMQASVGDIEINRDSLRMINPKLEGVTDEKGEYILTADYAEQDTSDLTTLYLHNVRATLTQADESWSKLTAPKGTFRTKMEQLELSGGIEVSSNTGATVKIDKAKIDMKKQTIKSKDPVEVQTEEAKLTADTLDIAAATKKILFKGNVHLHIVKLPKDAKAGDKKTVETQ